MFCIKCGEKAFHGNFCERCYLEKKELFSLKETKLRYCDNCTRYYSPREFIEPNYLERFIEKQIIAKNNIKKIDIKVNARPDKIHAIITAHGFVKPSKMIIVDKKEIFLYPRKMKCENCIKILGSYHEAVIQVRGESKEKIIKRLEKIIKPGEFANIANLKEGYDIRVIDKAVAARASQFLREKGFKIVTSFKLVGEKKGKKIYRNFYSVR